MRSPSHSARRASMTSPSMEETLRIYNAKKAAIAAEKSAKEAATRKANAPPPMIHSCSKCGSPCRGGNIANDRVFCHPCYDQRLREQTPR